jgi:hypothetical protein
MTSEKQIIANRANAEKSTGPKTPETKAISARNALRHGMTGQINLMPNEDREAHDKFCAAIVESLAPEGALEIQFSQSVAEDNWRANRGRAIETNMFAVGNLTVGNMGTGTDLGHPEIDAAANAAEVFSEAAHKFQLLSLYMQRTNRDMQKSLDRLTALQTDRRTRQQQDLEELASLLEYNEIKHLPIENTETKGTNGFVFSIHRIHAFVIRKRLLKQAEAARNKQTDHQNNGFHGKHGKAQRILSRAA